MSRRRPYEDDDHLLTCQNILDRDTPGLPAHASPMVTAPEEAAQSIAEPCGNRVECHV